MKKHTILFFLIIFSISFVLPSYSQEDLFMQIIKEGLIGAGAGAVGGAASGAKGRDVWKGALAGAGINIVGRALLDSISGSSSGARSSYTGPVQSTPPYTQVPGQYVTVSQPTQIYVPAKNSYNSVPVSYQEAYRAGYLAGYKEGYVEGLKAR